MRTTPALYWWHGVWLTKCAAAGTGQLRAAPSWARCGSCRGVTHTRSRSEQASESTLACLLCCLCSVIRPLSYPTRIASTSTGCISTGLVLASAVTCAGESPRAMQRRMIKNTPLYAAHRVDTSTCIEMRHLFRRFYDPAAAESRAVQSFPVHFATVDALSVCWVHP